MTTASIMMTITPLYYILYLLIFLMIIIACAFIIKKPVMTKSVILPIIFITVFSLGLYQFVGNPQGYRSYLYLSKINQLITEIQAHLQVDPTSREGWYLLGKLYLSQNRIQDANAAFARASIKDAPTKKLEK